jgi:hypothetical protein
VAVTIDYMKHFSLRFAATLVLLLAFSALSAFAQGSYPAMVEGKTYTENGVSVKFSRTLWPGAIYVEVTVTNPNFVHAPVFAIGHSQGSFSAMTSVIPFYNPQTNSSQALALLPDGDRYRPVQYIRVLPAIALQGFREF